jgi:hypothetical protein
VGVGILGKQEQPVALMLSPKATGSQSEGQHSVVKAFELGSKSPPRPGSIGAYSRRIFSDHNARAKDVNNADEFSAKARRSRSCCDPGSAVFLAGVATNDDVGSPLVDWLGREGSRVVMPSHSGPMLCEDSPSEVADFNLPCTG